MGRILYKYLDAQGGACMLVNKNLQFTNATQLNDPFDSHPGLIDFSNVPEERKKVWSKEIIMQLEANRYENLRDDAWICSLSKVYDSLLMWSYYGGHKGVCIGIDMDKANHYLSKIRCKITYGATELDVQYLDVINKPDFFKRDHNFYRYQLATKAKEWTHEQEVRLVLIDPSPEVMLLSPGQAQGPKEIDWKEVCAYPTIGGECFESLYLGIKMKPEHKAKIIDYARQCNPNIKIYQMTVDPEAFKLKEQLLQLNK